MFALALRCGYGDNTWVHSVGDGAPWIAQQSLPRTGYGWRQSSPGSASCWTAIIFWNTCLDFTQNLERAMDALALARRHLWLASGGFSLSAADTDVQELPVALYHPLSDSLAHAA